MNFNNTKVKISQPLKEEEEEGGIFKVGSFCVNSK